MMIYDVRAVQAHDKMLGRHFNAFDKATSGKPAKRNRKAIVRVGSGEVVRLSLSDLHQDMERARARWKTYYRTLPKFGRTSEQSYKENGLWRRFQNRKRKYEAAYENARTAKPTA